MQVDNRFCEEDIKLSAEQLVKLSCFDGNSSSGDEEENNGAYCPVKASPPINPIPLNIAYFSSHHPQHVQTLSLADITPYIFKENFRMKNPLLLKNACAAWPSTHNTWSIPSNFIGKMSTEGGVVLSSKDNKHFLYHELCDQVEITATSAISEIFYGRDVIRKLYCRLYLSEHPDLLADLNMSILAELSQFEILPITSEKEKITDNCDSFPFKLKNCGVWVSSAGCVTPLHYDLCHGYLCQIGTITY